MDVPTWSSSGSSVTNPTRTTANRFGIRHDADVARDNSGANGFFSQRLERHLFLRNGFSRRCTCSERLGGPGRSWSRHRNQTANRNLFASHRRTRFSSRQRGLGRDRRNHIDQRHVRFCRRLLGAIKSSSDRGRNRAPGPGRLSRIDGRTTGTNRRTRKGIGAGQQDQRHSQRLAACRFDEPAGFVDLDIDAGDRTSRIVDRATYRKRSSIGRRTSHFG